MNRGPTDVDARPTEEDFSDAGWQDFLALRMSAILPTTETERLLVEETQTGFRDRYQLALRIVQILSVAGLLALAGLWISSRPEPSTAVTTDVDAVDSGDDNGASDVAPDATTDDSAQADDDVSRVDVTGAPTLVCDPIDLRGGAAIPAVVPCVDGQLQATGDLDAGWDTILSGWEVNEGIAVSGVWDDSDAATPDSDTTVSWTGRDAHRETDEPDNRYQEIQVSWATIDSSFSIYETWGLIDRSVTFTFVPNAAGSASDNGASPADPLAFQVPEGRRLAVQAGTQTSIIWDGVPDEDDVVDEASGNRVAASLITTDRLIGSIEGTIHLAPSDAGNLTGLWGGIYIRLNRNRDIGLAGGQSAQFGLVNSRMGSVVDASSGICVDDSCSVDKSQAFVTPSSLDIDAVSGLRFKATVVNEIMTLVLSSIGSPDEPEAVVSIPWEGGIGAAVVEVAGNDQPFAGQLNDVYITYAGT